MFAVGLGPVANTAFGISTAIIAIPTGVKIFNWMATMYGGDLRFKVPMLFAIGTVTMFVIGGLSGVTHSVVPADYQQTDTYYIVAHFHYVLFGGAVMGIFSGMYYWWPKVFGRMLGEKLGKLNFWLIVIGLTLTFGPMHILGLQGMIRRTYTYPPSLGLTFWNQVASVGAFTIALGVLMFVVNVITSMRHPKDAPADPWDGRTLEWSISSPPPTHNFDDIPVVHALDDFWHRKYVEDRRGVPVPVQAGASDASEHHPSGGHGIHMPGPSYWPLVAAVGFPMVGYGIMYTWWLAFAGVAVMLTGFYGWALEPSAE
jgi:cytochrome c oxidase subunit 1